MKKYRVIVTLENEKEIEIITDFVYSINDNMNDIKNPFIDIGEYTIKKDNIVSIKKEELSEAKEEVGF